MGAGQGTTLRLIDEEIELLRETRDFARWTLGDVMQLHKRFQKSHGMAITESQFDNLLLLKASGIVGSREIFAVLDTNRDGRIDGLEFVAALACVCRASFEEKARYAFELFDFNLNGSLSLTELALLMKSVCVGMSLLTGHVISATPGAAASGSATSVAKFLQLAQHAFDRFDRDGGASLQYEEFIEWARSNREFMLQVEQFRVISDKAVGFEETLSLPNGSDNDSDLEDEMLVLASASTNTTFQKQSTLDLSDEIRRCKPSTAPWIVEPTSIDEAPEDRFKYDFPPPINVGLEWIYGYSGSAVRNAVRFLTNGDVVYVVSKYAIVYTSERHEQRHYFGHKYPITCIDVNATGTIVATGDAVPHHNQHSEIHVWNGLTLECLSVLSSFHVDSIASVAFPAPPGIQTATPHTTGGVTGRNANLAGAVASAKKQHHAAETLLISIGTDANASMALWDWQHAHLLASGRAINKRKRVLCVAMSEDGHEVLVGGEHFLVFHHVDGRFFKMKKPKGLETKMQTMPTCLSASYYGPNTAIVGTARGELLQFNHMQLARIIQAHDVGQSINICSVSCRSMVLFTAGKDGMLKQWDSTLRPIGNTVDLHRSAIVEGLKEEDFRVHSMAYDSNRQRFAVGTRHGHLIEVLETNQTTRVVASSHKGSAIDALATSRFGVCFVTCSIVDRTIHVWNMRRRTKERAVKLTFPPLSCAFSAVDGEYLAVGGNEGSIALFRAKSMSLLSQMKNTQSAINCLRFHPSESTIMLAACCVNGAIYFYTVDDTDSVYRFHRFALLKPAPGEPSSIIHSIDFSTDGQFMKSQHGQGDTQDTASLRFWKVRKTSQSVSRITTMSTVRNVQWQTYSSTVGWHVRALEADHIASLSSNFSASVVATLDKFGQLAFRHFPCASESDNRKPLAIVVANAHLQGAGDVGFALHDTLLLSTHKGSGSVVCQWAISNETQDSQPRATTTLDSPEMWACLSSHGLEDLYFFDDSYTPRSNQPAIDASVPPSTTNETTTSALANVDTRSRSEAPDLDLSLTFVHGLNHTRSGANQVFVAMSGTTGMTSSLVFGIGTLVVGLLVTTTQVMQQRILVSGLKYDISSIVKQSNSMLAISSRRDNRVLLWQWEPTAQQLGVLRGPPRSSHVLTAFDLGEFNDQLGQTSKDFVAVVWYSPAAASHVIRFYYWRKTRDQDHTKEDDGDHAIEADMTRLPVLFGFFTPPLQSSTVQQSNVVGFVSGGVDHVTFWWLTISTSHIVCQSGVFGRHAHVETAICGAYAAPYVLTGMDSGAIIVWDNGVAAFSLPTLETTAKDCETTGVQAVVSIVAVPSKQQVVVALRSGHIVLFSSSKESDLSRYRANSFLQRVRVVHLFDGACVWKTIKPAGKPFSTVEDESNKTVQAARISACFVQTLTVLDELQNGFAVVLNSGQILHVDGQALSTATPSFIARVVVDIGEQITAMALHPIEPWVALGNSDGRVHVYAIETHALLYETRSFQSPVKALTWQQTPNARMAVSLTHGHIAMLNAEDFTVEADFSCGPNGNSSDREPKKWCWVMRFSPNQGASTWLAAACRNYHIYVYKCTSSDLNSPMICELAHDFSGHTAPISTFDFSVDGNWLQSATSALDSQLMRWNLSEMGQDTRALSSNDPTTWDSWTAAVGGPVAGLAEVLGPSVTSVDRIKGDASGSRERWNSRLPTLLAGTETGRVLLGWFPLRYGEGKLAMFKEYDGYLAVTSSVNDVRFCANNEYAVTFASSQDGSRGQVLVWKTDYEDELQQLQRVHSTDSNHLLTPNIPVEKEEAPATKILLEKDDQRFADQIRNGGDEFMAVKPWLGAIREPSVLPPGMATASASPPVADLALEFVYGVNPNATNTRNDVYYADDSWEIVYSAASFGVVYNTKTRTQLLNATHSGQMISCVAVHPGRGDLVVTGEIAGGKKIPRLVAWDVNSGSTITQIESVHTRGVALLAFAPSGDRIATVGMDDDHVLAIYALSQSQGLAKFKLLAHMKSSKQPVYALAFHHDNDTELITAGLNHVLFWSTNSTASGSNDGSLSRGRQRGSASSSSGKGSHSSGADAPVTLSMKKGLFGTGGGRDGGATAKVLAAAYVPRSQQQAQIVTAQHDGSLFVWKARQCIEVKPNAHKGAIYALVVDQKKPHTVYSGGQDGKINLWTSQLELLVTLDLEKLCSEGPEAPLFNAIVKSLAARESRILFSTDGGDVGELVPEDPNAHHSANIVKSFKPQIHLRSHCKGELWGLATHPTKLQFATAGDDGSVRLWDAPTRSLLAIYQAKSSSHKWRTIAFSSDGSHVVVGSSDGNVLVLSETLDAVVKSWRCSPKAVAIVKFAPESRLLAIGTHDQGIYVYDGHTYKPAGVCRGHSSTVTHLDFSSDGRFLQSSSTAGELLFWDLSGDMKRIPSATAVRDTQWITWTLPYGWPVQGIWPLGSDGSDVNAVSRSGDRKVVATSDDFGFVKLFNYPCTTAQAQHKSFAGHASHVTNCSFARDDYYLLTTGGIDNTICQYKYYDNNAPPST